MSGALRMIVALLLLVGIAGVVVGPMALAADGDAAAGEVDLGDAGIPEPPLGDPPGAEELDLRTEALAKGLRCPVCQALSVADSSSDAARAMHARIRDFVAQGYTNEQIEDYFVDRYGEWVRLEPPATGLNLVVWLAPLVALLVGVGLVVGRLKNDDDPLTGPGVAPAPAAADDPYRRQVLAELGEAEAPSDGAAGEAEDSYRERVLAELEGESA